MTEGKSIQVNLSDPLLTVQDPSKIQKYLCCHRQYFLEYVMNLRIDGTIHNLVFGTSYHKAKDILFSLGYSSKTIELAYEAFLDEYRKTYSDDTDLDFGGKSPANVKKALNEYILEYQFDNFEVLHTEVNVTVPIGPGREITGNPDTIVRDPVRGITCIDTKTAKALWSYTDDSYQQKTQVLAYTHFLHSYYDEKVYGMIIDITIFTKTLQHVRVHCNKTIDRMESWLYEINCTFDELEKDFEQLSKDKPDDLFMKSFIRNTESCIQYNRICPYFELCHAWNNPLQHMGQIPSGFKIEVWDPRNTGHKVDLSVTNK